LSVVEAEKLGCQIVTVPDAVLKKYGRLGKKDLVVSIEKSKSFRDDALKTNLHF
jgi:transaldolase